MQALKFGEETLNQKNDCRHVRQKMYKKSSNIGMPGGGGKKGFPYNYEMEGMLPLESSKTHVRGRHTIQKSETEIGMAIAMLLTVCAISQTGNV